MKKKIISVCLIAVLVICASVFGPHSSASASSTAGSNVTGTYSSGKTALPSFYTYKDSKVYVNYWMNLSNITDNPITVTITLYDKNGSVITDDNNPNTGYISTPSPTFLNYSDQNPNYTVSFKLNAHSTGALFVNGLSASNDYEYGYGIIQWNQPSANTLQGLVAQSGTITMSLSTNIEVARNSFAINGGLPF